ncbi:polyunsaturated fatty acid 5-lipoxygenase-like [Haliotis asinina]|uniref:polyunsaturated fatty acid 5-lipoxygenase-like n=1 Tax=Haliotis asinina TaxID=109174 RepID=UPI0035327A98
MGNNQGSHIIVTVKTGDRKCAGTNASVWFVAKDEQGNSSDEIKLNQLFESNFDRGKKDVFELSKSKFAALTSPVDRIEIWRDYTGLTSTWFLETVIIEDPDCNVQYTFPVFRWIRPSYKYVILQYDASLPQEDVNTEQREVELEETRRTYKLSTADTTLPIQVAQVPDDEAFPDDFKRCSVVELVETRAEQLKKDEWTCLQDIGGIYASEEFYIPKCHLFWQEDWCFGYQRLNGVNPLLIKLCSEIPKKFAVSDSMIKPFLEGQSVKTALKNNKLFVCDLEILKDLVIPNEELTICAPIALFYLDKRNTLVPIAIQLFQERSDDNPVFLPSDDHYTWMLAKLWYNNAEANHHLAVTYIGTSCLLTESVGLSMHRHLSISHPLFKMLAPYFTNIMAANSDIMQNLLADEGVVDRVATIGARGVKKIIRKSLESWRFNVNSCLPEDVVKRGVSDIRVLPNYFYRDDGMLLYYAIQNYVIKYIMVYYADPDSIQNDTELQNWLKEMATCRDDGGMGIEGLPGDGSVCKPEQLQDLVTSIIFTCTAQQAAVGGAMYDTYGFPPNYPLKLSGAPPTDKTPREESDVLTALQTDTNWDQGVALAQVLSDTVNKGILGDGDSVYLYDPRAAEIHTRFVAELDEIGKVIRDRNSSRDHCYHYLIPGTI